MSQKTKSTSGEGTQAQSVLRQALLALAALGVLWSINLVMLHRGPDPVSGLQSELARFDYNPDAAYVVEAETRSSLLGYHGRVRFRFNDDSGADVEVEGKRTLAFFDWTINSLISR